MPLQKLEISGYKSIREASLDFQAINILIGPNGAGKSNLISIFRLLNEMIERKFQKFVMFSGGANNLLHNGTQVTDQLTIKADWGRNAYKAVWKSTVTDTLFFESEVVELRTDGYEHPYTDWLLDDQLETGLLREAEKKPGKVASYVLQEMQRWKVYHFHDTSNTAPLKRRGAINDNVYFRPNASNLAAFLFRLKKTSPDSYNAICSTIKLVTPFFRDFLLRPYLDTDSIQLEWFEESSDFPFKAHQLSDGTLRFICLATLLLQPTLPSVIVIDEPELGLHPYAIVVLASLIKAASKRCQLILSTQSLELLNEFAFEDIIVVDKRDGESSFVRPDRLALAKWLDEYTLGDLWQKNVLGGRPSP